MVEEEGEITAGEGTTAGSEEEEETKGEEGEVARDKEAEAASDKEGEITNDEARDILGNNRQLMHTKRSPTTTTEEEKNEWNWNSQKVPSFPCYIRLLYPSRAKTKKKKQRPENLNSNQK